MFPFTTRAAWLRSGASGHLDAIAGLAEPMLSGDEWAVLVARRRAHRRWSQVAGVLLSLLLVGGLAATASGLVAAFGLAAVASPLIASIVGLAGLLGLSYAVTTWHINRLQADLWGILAIAALRPRR